MTRGEKRGVKRGENSLASNQIPKCSTAQNTQRNSELCREEKRDEGDEVTGVEKRESRKGREQSSQQSNPSSFEEIGLPFLGAWCPLPAFRSGFVELFKTQMIF